MDNSLDQTLELPLPDAFNSVPEAFYARARRYPQTLVYEQAEINPAQPAALRPWRSRNYSQVAERISRIANYLVGIGIPHGAKIALLGNTRPEWLEAEIAIQTAGAVAVSIYSSLPAKDVGFILFDSGSEFVFAENQEQVDKLRKIMTETLAMPAIEDRPAQDVRLELKGIISFESCDEHPLVTSLAVVLKKGSPEFPAESVKSIARTDIATLVYTSGASGQPKGVLQSHANHLANIRQSILCGSVPVKTTIFLFLQLAHSYAKLMGYIGFVTEATLKFPAVADRRFARIDLDSYARDIREGSAKMIPMVPRVLEKMQAGIMARAHQPGLAAALLRLTLWAARQVYTQRAVWPARAAFMLTSSVRRKIKRMLFGPSFSTVVCGGAKLSLETARFFDMLGIMVLEGYGLTEACVGTHCNRPDTKRLGSVGQSVSIDLEDRIAADGELLLRGPNVPRAYHRRDAATRETWDSDGWLHTGDLGKLDADGFLTITGRKKDILITSNGENISPEPFEEGLKRCPFAAHCLLLGDGRPHLAALIALNPVEVAAYFQHSDLTLPADLAQDPKVHQLLWEEVQKINLTLPMFMAVRKIAIVSDEFTVENGLLTPTLKVKRQVAAERYRSQIEALY